MKKILSLIKKHKDILLYLVFGVLTTAVNWSVYYPLVYMTPLGGSAAVCKTIAWAVSVVFAFLTNKPFVFYSYDWSPSITIPELLKFVGGRLASGGMEVALIFLFVDLLHGDANIWNLIVSVLVVMANYVISKVFVFRQKK